MRQHVCTALVIGVALGASPTFTQAQVTDTTDQQDDCGSRGVRVLRPESCSGAQKPSPQPIEPARQPDRRPPVRLPNPAPGVNCERSFPHADLKLGQPGFDAALNQLLIRNADSVVVDADDPFAAAEPPQALAGWLAEVQRTGGQVSRKAIDCGGRGFSLFRALKAFFAPRANAYAPVKDYNVTLWLEPESGQVTQVQFTRRVIGG